jgi:hypothetical protein
VRTPVWASPLTAFLLPPETDEYRAVPIESGEGHFDIAAEGDAFRAARTHEVDNPACGTDFEPDECGVEYALREGKLSIPTPSAIRSVRRTGGGAALQRTPRALHPLVGAQLLPCERSIISKGNPKV